MNDADDQNWFSAEITTFGDRIAGGREAAGMTQTHLARALGVRLATLRGWENDMSEPRANKLQMLAGVLGVSIGWLLTGEGNGPDGPQDTMPAPDARAALAEMRQLAAETDRIADRLAQLEKRLRRSIAPL